MGLNSTPGAQRVHIGIFGNTNAGKSSIVNAITGQHLSIVSDVSGTTTDPVYKAMELLPLGPVMIIDTPGLDDTSELGKERIKKGFEIINKTDIALLVVDGTKALSENEKSLIARFKKDKIPFIVAINKCDLPDFDSNLIINQIKNSTPHIEVSADKSIKIHELKEMIAKLLPDNEPEFSLVKDLISEGDLVVLVVPIDSAAPKGRLILPQQQVIRDVLEAGAIPVVTRESELTKTFESLSKKPSLVITDSQVFKYVSSVTPDDIILTSFSILMARFKGNLENAVMGAAAIENLKDGDTILISEGCTHHRQCDDIGTVKLPKWIKNYTNLNLSFEFTSGRDFPTDLSKYNMIVHCGACMLNEQEMKNRYKHAIEQNIPITNYGTMIAYINGILKRTLAPFPSLANLCK